MTTKIVLLRIVENLLEPAYEARRRTFYLLHEKHIEHTQHVPDGELIGIGPRVGLPEQEVIAHCIKGAPHAMMIVFQ